MTERYFPFTSVDEDRVYGSVDFRSFFRAILTNGRMAYAEYDISADNSLQCAMDLVDTTLIVVSAGAVLNDGALYQTDATVPIFVELPTGSTVKTGYIVARIDEYDERLIKIMDVPTINQFTDVHLATYTANSVGVRTVTNTYNVAESRYRLKPDEIERVIELIANDQDLINTIADNPELITAVAANPDLIAGLVANLRIDYTYIIASDETLEAWARGSVNDGVDYSRVLVKKGVWKITSDNTSGGTSANRIPVIDLSDGRTTKIIGEEGAVIEATLTRDYMTVFRDRTTLTSISESDGMRTIEGLTVRAIGNHSSGNITNSVFVGCNNLTNVTAEMSNAVSVNSDKQAFFACSNLKGCSAILNDGARRVGFLNCKNLDACKVVWPDSGLPLTSNFDNSMFLNCTNLTRCSGLSELLQMNVGVVAKCFSGCSYLYECEADIMIGGSGSIPNGFYNCERLRGCTGYVGYVNGIKTFGYNSCDRLDECDIKFISGQYGMTGPESSPAGAGYAKCNGLSNCTGQNTGGSYGVIYYKCKRSADGSGLNFPTSGVDPANNAEYGWNIGNANNNYDELED